MRLKIGKLFDLILKFFKESSSSNCADFCFSFGIPAIFAKLLMMVELFTFNQGKSRTFTARKIEKIGRLVLRILKICNKLFESVLFPDPMAGVSKWYWW